MKTLHSLINELPGAKIFGDGTVPIAGIKADSRQVEPGDLFVAIRGLNVDGHQFISGALHRGASAIAGERCLEDIQAILGGSLPVPYIQVHNGREALAHLAAAWFDHPGRKLRVIGVTGTDGKTTTVNLIMSILAAAGYSVGMVSTVSAVINGQEHDTGFHVTTPEAMDVQGYLSEMVAASAQYAVLEATSHGLEQHRVTACEFDVAVVTNITHEHLDYHGTFETYREAKSLLFRSLMAAYRKEGMPKVAVLNADDSSYPYLREIPADVHFSYGLERKADVMASDLQLMPSGLTFVAHTPADDFSVKSPLVGRFNVYNILAAITVGLSQKLPVEAMRAGIQAMRGVRGRMERIDLGQDFTVLIDFAHTPNSLERALETVRAFTSGKVIVVFGCAGLRDRAKRPAMGEIAGRLADRVIITAEDPRTEDVNDIIAQIAVGCQRAGRREGEGYWRIPDRQEAIDAAIAMARARDLVIITGKGHEQSMCYGTTEYPWSDHEAAEKALRKRLSTASK